MKFPVADIGGSLHCAEDDGPANLQCAQIALGQRSSGKVQRRDRNLFAAQAAQVIGKQPNFLQLRRRRSDSLTDIREREKFGLNIESVLLKRTLGFGGSRDARTRTHSTFPILRRQVQFHLVFFAQCPSFDATRAQVTGKRSSKTVERKYSPGLYQFDIADQIFVIRVIRKRKCCVDLVTVNNICINCPASDHRHTFARNSFQHMRPVRAWRADEDFPCNIVRLVANVFAKRLAELLVDARHLINRAVQHGSQAGPIKRTQNFLRLA